MVVENGRELCWDKNPRWDCAEVTAIKKRLKVSFGFL
jgi:hypothetical protein